MWFYIILMIPYVGRADAFGQCDPACATGLKCCKVSNTCFDDSKQLCCNGTILDRVGLMPQCCGNKEIDYAKQTCCDDMIYNKTGVTWCCGNVTYSPKTDMCCNKVVVPYGSCITTTSFYKAIKNLNEDCNPSCAIGYKCCKTECYNQDQQLCCQGTLQSKTGVKPQCCGTQVIDFTKQICCNDVPQDKLSGTITFCCGSLTYSPFTNSCCSDVIMPKGNCTEA